MHKCLVLVPVVDRASTRPHRPCCPWSARRVTFRRGASDSFFGRSSYRRIVARSDGRSHNRLVSASTQPSTPLSSVSEREVRAIVPVLGQCGAKASPDAIAAKRPSGQVSLSVRGAQQAVGDARV